MTLLDNKLKEINMITNNENRTFGVEVEFISNTLNQNEFVAALNLQLGITGSELEVVSAYYSDTDATKWRIKTDASVMGQGYGLELVSPILQGAQGEADLITVLEAMNTLDITANKTCGLHVHVGVSDWQIGNFKNLYKRYAKFESTLDSIMPVSRRKSNGDYCRSNLPCFIDTNYDVRNLPNKKLAEAFKSIDKCTTLRKLGNKLDNRYVKLNLQSFWKHGTIEFRHHSGTTDVAKITNWLTLCMAMVIAGDEKRVVKVKSNDTVEAYKDNINSFFNGLAKVAPQLITNELKTFYRRRRRALCA